MSKITDLREKYSKVTESTFNRIVESDKTATKKYCDFLLKTWSNRSENGCPSTINGLVKLVDSFNELLPYIPCKDIYDGRYGDIYCLERVLEEAAALKDEKTFVREEHVNVLDETDDYLFVQPITHKGSLKYGANTRWCTASKNNPATFNSYAKSALLAYLIDKTDKTTPQYRKLAFYSNWNNGGVTNNIEIYNTSDSTCQDKSIMSGGWSDETLLKMVTIYRMKFITHKKIKDSIDAVNSFGNTLKRLDFDLLKDSLEKLEQSV